MALNLVPFIGLKYEGDRFCQVLARAVLADHGIPLPDVNSPDQAKEWQPVDRPLELDVVVFNIAGTPGHIGVCIGSGKFIHCEEGERSRIDHLSSPLWGKRIQGFYRWKHKN